MGLNANITVHGWRKPTLTVSLVAGGTLLPNTKYYVVGVMGYTPSTYLAIGSPTSDVYDITTTTTDLSIQISHKTYRDITAFTDNLDSRTLITSARHCVTDIVMGYEADIIKIDTGSYAGTWTVDEWVDYDTFIIDTPYVDNVPVQFYTDSVRYNRPKLTKSSYPLSHGMAYYVHPTDPYATGEFSTAYVWSRAPWHTNNIENPTIITALGAQRFGPYSVLPDLVRLNKGIYKVLDPYGVPTIEISGMTTPADVHDEVQSSGFIYNFGYEEDVGYPKNPQLNCFAALRFYGVAGFSVYGAAVTLLIDVNQNSDPSLVAFHDCSITFPVGFFSAYLNFTAEKCVVFNNSTSNSFVGWIPGDDSVFYIVPRAQYGNVDVSNLKYNNLFGGPQLDYGIVQNKEYRDTGASTLFQNSYNSIKFVNVTVFPIYWLFNKSVHPDVYMMENCTINYAGGYDWHFRFYDYAITDPIIVDYLNVNTPDSNNVKQCIHNSVVNLTANFYRRVEFYVQGNGLDILGAAIHIIDNDGNEYNTTTDIDGYGYIDCLEQKTVFVDTDPTLSNHDPQYDTLYTDFVITISKANYISDVYTIDSLYTNEKQTVGLVEPVYIQQSITGIVTSNEVSGQVSQNTVKGTITVETDVGGNTAEEEVSGSVETVEVSGTIS